MLMGFHPVVNVSTASILTASFPLVPELALPFLSFSSFHSSDVRTDVISVDATERGKAWFGRKI